MATSHDSFDLDLAFIMEDSSAACSTINIEVQESLPPTSDHDQKISCMPTVSGVGVCTVCMEDFQSSIGGGGGGSGGGGGCKQVPCGHVYHANCITQWLSLHNSCPLCRCEIPGVPVPHSFPV